MLPSHGDFTVGWVTGIRKEYTAARQVLDEEFESTNFVLPRGDRNTYTYGRVAKHYVLITCLQNAQYGIESASDAAYDMRSSFPMIRVLLIVGIAGGIPSPRHDIRLGDVVVGTEIVRYEIGDATEELNYTSHIEPPGRALFTGTQGLAVQLDEGLDLHELLEKTFTKTQKIKDDYQRPRNRLDRLLKADYEHASSCECLSSGAIDENTLVARTDRPEYDRITVHTGRIGSTHITLNDAGKRDRAGKELGILCSKQEPSSSTNKFACLHIRGICDYSDSHQNHMWNGFAAAAASVYAKKLLQTIAAEEVWRMNISIDTKNLQQFTEHLVYEVNQATNISARLAELKTKLTTTDRALRGVKTGVELLVQLAQEAMSGGQRQSTDTQLMRDHWETIAARQADLKRALNNLGAHIKTVQKTAVSKESRLECDRLNIRLQMSSAALQDLNTLIRPMLSSTTTNGHDHDDTTGSDVMSIACSESTRKTSNLSNIGGKFSDLSTKAFTKPERHTSKQSISDFNSPKERNDPLMSPDLLGHKKGNRWSNVFRNQDKHRQESGSFIEPPASENDKLKGLGMGWRHSIQSMRGNMSRSDVSSSTERGSERTLVVEKPSAITRKEIMARPDSPQELPVSLSNCIPALKYAYNPCLGSNEF
ncbi:hypothetical protein N7488_003265 [Penicillium malachiteum]|nr:hypothetical protein N7488_003265 [Penicillium malachiteum]